MAPLLEGITALNTNNNRRIYRPISGGGEIHRRYGLWIIGGQTTRQSPGGMSNCPLRRFDFYNLSHLIEGEGLASFEGGGTQRVREGDCVVVTPGMVNAFGSTDENIYVEDTLLFLGPVADRLREDGVLSAGVYPFGTQRKLRTIAEMVRDPSVSAQLNANLALLQLLMDMYNQKCRQTPRRDAIEEVVAAIKNAPERWWTVEDLVELSGMSYGKLRRSFIAQTGVCPKNYIEQFKMHRAAELLHNGNSIADTARQLGYRTAYHFSSRFRMHFGTSPGHFRLKIKRV